MWYFANYLAVLLAILLGGSLFANVMQEFFAINPLLNTIIAILIAYGIVSIGYRFWQGAMALTWWQSPKRHNNTAPFPSLLRRLDGHALHSSSFANLLYNRLGQQRQTIKYLAHLLVMTGLLGTFWGLLKTLSSLTGLVSSTDFMLNDVLSLTNDQSSNQLKPVLKSMGTAFSSSFFGILGSVILNFMEMQLAALHNSLTNLIDRDITQPPQEKPQPTSDAEVLQRLQKMEVTQEHQKRQDRIAALMREITQMNRNVEESMKMLASSSDPVHYEQVMSSIRAYQQLMTGHARTLHRLQQHNNKPQ